MRRLAIFSFAFAAATLFCNYLPASWLFLPVGAVLAVLGALLFPLHRGRRVRLALLGLAAGVLWFCGYNALRYAPLRAYDGFEGRAHIEITGESVAVEHGGRRVEGKLGKAGLRLTYYEESAPDLRPGDLIEADIRCSLASTLTGDERFASRGIFLLAYTSGEMELVGSNASALRYLPQRVTHAVRERLRLLYDARALPFMTALLTGDRQLLYGDEALTSSLSDTGTSHIVAISGMHIGFLISLLQLLLGKRKGGLIACIPFVLFFIVMVGATPSVVRAGVMALFLIGAQLFMREYDPATAISASLLLLLLQNPYSIQNVGLQLSYAAVIGIALFSPRLRARLMRPILRRKPHRVLRRLCNGVTSTVAASLSASVTTIPLVALHFGYVSLISPLVNLAVLWAVSLCFSCGLVSVLLGFLWLPLGTAAAWLPGLLARGICALIRLAARIPNAALYTENRYVVFWIVFCYALFALVLARRELRRHFWLPLSTLAASLALILLLTALERPGLLTAAAIDVGQGACTALLTEDYTVLVDCGGDHYEGAGTRAAEYLLAQGRRRIDTLILTHFHEDHANGVPLLLTRMEVGRLIVPRLDDYGALGEAILQQAGEANIPVQYIDEETELEAGSMTLALFPPVGVGDENEEGLSLLGRVGGFELLITGDMSDVTEQALLRRYALPDIELLFVGHHGSRYSTSERLLETVRPEIAFISVGAGNSYGHPASQTLERLGGAGVVYYRTDECGTVQFRLNGGD